MIEDFQLPERETESEVMVTMTLWVPYGTKKKYQQLQERSRKKFGKHLVNVLKKVIDKVEVEKSA